MLIPIPPELSGVFDFQDGKPVLKGKYTKEQEKIFQKLAKEFEEEERKRFIWEED